MHIVTDHTEEGCGGATQLGKAKILEDLFV